MSLDRTFRLSFYLTLALASACLGYAEYPLLPEIALLVWPIGLALLAGYLLEGRWSMTIGVANGVGACIAAGAGLWTLYRLMAPPAGAVEGTPLLLRLLPHMGILLVVLMLALLFRPKQLNNYWFLYGISFVAVALACALDSDFVFGLLLLAFVGCGLWSLAIFYLWCGARFTRAGQQNSGALAAPVPWLGVGLWQALWRCAVIVGLAFVFFSLTPRAALSPWDLPGARGNLLASGLGEPIVDLNRTGTVRLSKTVAFEVQAETAKHRPKLDVDPGQRWRTMTLHNYEHGRWFNRTGPAINPAATQEGDLPPPSPVQPGENLPDMGPNQFFLTITFSGRLAGRRLALAEPVTLSADPVRLPVKFIEGGTPPAWQVSGGILPPRHRCVYTQAVVPAAEPGLSALLRGDEPQYRKRYKDPVNAPGVRDWTIDLLHRLVARGELRRSDIELNQDGNLLPAHHERVARALESYLSTSGDYSYTLELSRRDPTADPVYDFLCNVKQGHCERFASGLAAMLRRLGVPARLVLGYRGVDSLGDGSYVVRDSHAHSWVEVLIERPGENGSVERWLTLDPTPSADLQPIEGFWGTMLRLAQQGGGAIWHGFIIDYDAERQEATVLEILNRLGLGDRPRGAPGGSAWSWAMSPWFWGMAALLSCLAVWKLWPWLRKLRWSRRPAKSLDDATSFYGRLLALLARRRALRPSPAQTPHEFAMLVGDRLRNEPRAEAVADVPEQLIRLYYRVRYAARPLSAAELAHVDRCLEQLEHGLCLRNAKNA